MRTYNNGQPMTPGDSKSYDALTVVITAIAVPLLVAVLYLAVLQPLFVLLAAGCVLLGLCVSQGVPVIGDALELRLKARRAARHVS